MKNRIYIFTFISLYALLSCGPNSQKVEEIRADWELVSSGLEFPEGPAWDGKGNLYFSNCHGGWIGMYSGQETDTFLTADIMKKTNGLTIGKDGALYACDYGINAILKISPQGVVDVLTDRFENTSFNRPNDLAFGSDGDLYFTDPKSYGENKLDGRLFRYSFKSAGTMLLRDSLAFPNGIAFSPSDNKLYVCESAKNRILRFTLTGKGTIFKEEVFIKLPGGDPDGIAFDVDGNLYVAHFGSGSLFIISPGGEILNTLKTPGTKPTNVEFAGEDLKTLYLTEVETNSLYRLSVPVAGEALY